MGKSTVPPLGRLGRALRRRFEPSPDSEPEQAAIRVIIASLIAGYLYSSHAFHDADGTLLLPFAFYFTIGFVAGSWLLLAAVLWRPGVSVPRRLIGMAADLYATTYGLYATGAVGSPMYMVYLWVAVGNGFRYGLAYLYAATALSSLGFAGVLATSPYWRANLQLGVGLVFGSVVLSIYVAALLRRLNEATRQAELASRAKGRFLAHMSHELRTPINSLLGAVELLGQQPPGRGHARFTDLVRSSADTLSTLTENILDLSALEEGKIAVRRVDFDLHETVNDTARLFVPMATRKGLYLDVYFAPSVSFGHRGDPIRLRQILINLLGNAVKFTERGGVQLRVTAAGDAGPGGPVRFEVTDTGIGIAEELRDRIFDRFARIDERAAGRAGGAGLGTTISRELVELLGGRIGVESADGRGSRFWFEIGFEPCPAELDTGAARALAGQPILLLTAESGDGPGLGRRLAAMGLDVARVTGSARARSRLLAAAESDRPFRAMVVDHQFLDRSPADFAASIRRAPALADLAMILVGPRLAPALDDLVARAGYRSSLRYDELERDFGNAVHACLSGTRPGAESRRVPAWDRPRAGAALDILLAEDEAVNQIVIRTFLETAGHRVRLAADGRAALDALAAGGYDLAIIDMVMPEMGGAEVIERVRAAPPGGGAPPFILLTANTTREARRRCAALGIAAYLTKPVSAKRLLETVDTAVSDHRERSGAAEPITTRR